MNLSLIKSFKVYFIIIIISVLLSLYSFEAFLNYQQNENISLKLKPKGILIFDCFNNVAFNRDKPLNIKKINHIIKPEFDYFNSTLNLISTSDNIPELNYDVNHRIWSVDILKEILTYNFKKINIFNHFSFTPLNENNYKLTFICQK